MPKGILVEHIRDFIALYQNVQWYLHLNDQTPLQPRLYDFFFSATSNNMSDIKKTRRGKRGKGAVKDKEMHGVIEENHPRVEENQLIFNQEMTEELDADTKAYFVQISSQLANIEERDEKELLVNNIYPEILKNAFLIATDFDTSKILENIISLSTEEQIKSLCEALKSTFSALAVHQFGSHVMESILLADHSFLDEKSDYNELLCNQYGSHVLRKIIDVLDKNDKTRLETLINSLNLDIKYLIHNQYGNPILQSLITVKPAIVDKILDSNDDIIQSLVNDRIGSHLLEKILVVCNDSTFKRIFKILYKDLLTYAKHPIANFVIQSMIQKVRKEKQFIKVLEILTPHFSEFMFPANSTNNGFNFGNRTGLVVKIIEKSLEYPTQQPEILKAIIAAFGSDDASELATLILNLKTKQQSVDKFFTHYPTVQGSLILQCLISYENSFVVQGIIALDQQTVILWCKDAIASRIIEKILDSSQPTRSQKRSLMAHFDGFYVELACNKYSSHIMDKSFNLFGLEGKAKVCDEFSGARKKMEADFHGRFVARNCGVDLYVRNRNSWNDHFSKKERRNKKIKTGPFDEIDAIFNKV